jgi:hypothetical protein
MRHNGSVVMLSVMYAVINKLFMLSVVMLNVFMLSVMFAVTNKLFILSVIILNIFMLIVIILNKLTL